MKIIKPGRDVGRMYWGECTLCGCLFECIADDILPASKCDECDGFCECPNVTCKTPHVEVHRYQLGDA